MFRSSCLVRSGGCILAAALLGHNLSARGQVPDAKLPEQAQEEEQEEEQGPSEPIRRMIEAAAETGNRAKLDSVIEAALAAYPDEAEAIDEMRDAGRERVAALASAQREQEQAALRQAGILDRWEGRGQLGGFRSTGSTDNLGLTAALDIERVGIDWRHKLRGRIDYQETNGRVIREQYLAAYEPRYQINPRLFGYALGQWEKDEFRGIEERIAASGGFGYRVIDGAAMQLSIKAGPAWRRTIATTGETESNLAALAGLDFDWQLVESIKLTQDTDLVAEGGGSATAFIGSSNNTLNLVTGLEANIIDSLTARLSYTFEYASDPPAGAANTDTLSRFTLIYDF